MSQDFTVTILGRGSASPTPQSHQAAQVVSVNSKLILIDGGDGTQNQMVRCGVSLLKLTHFLVSHMHADHFGGIGALLSTMGMKGRQKGLQIFGPATPDGANIEDYINYTKLFFGGHDAKSDDLGFGFPVEVTKVDTFKPQTLFSDHSIRISSFPIYHGMPSMGFIIEELPKQRHIRKEAITQYNIPVCYLQNIKDGKDYITQEGQIIPNREITTDADRSRKFVYCSDTRFSEKYIPFITGADILYHEATFMNKDLPRAKTTNHSTAAQAAQIAKQAGVKKLLIGHFSSRYTDTRPLVAEAQEIFENTEEAKEGHSYNIPL